MDLDPNLPAATLLKQGSWFGGLPQALQSLILRRSVVRSFQKGQPIIREGEPPKGIFAVLEGRVRALRQSNDADEILIHVGEAGLWFGEYGLLSGKPSIGSVVADCPTRVLMLAVADFEAIVAEEPRYYRHFSNLAIERYAILYRYLAEGPRLSPDEWLCTRLADLAALRRQDIPATGTVTLAVSQADLATMIGVSRQTLNALLSRLQARGLIDVGFRRICVLDEAGLRRESLSAAPQATTLSGVASLTDA